MSEVLPLHMAIRQPPCLRGFCRRTAAANSEYDNRTRIDAAADQVEVAWKHAFDAVEALMGKSLNSAYPFWMMRVVLLLLALTDPLPALAQDIVIGRTSVADGG